MLRTELNAKGSFKSWNPLLLSEIQEQQQQLGDMALGQELVFEDNSVKIWSVMLFPKERLPFRRLNLNHSWIALTDGIAITRSCDGSAELIRFEKGESNFLEFENKTVLQDLENAGGEPFLLNFMEFKKEETESAILGNLNFESLFESI